MDEARRAAITEVSERLGRKRSQFEGAKRRHDESKLETERLGSELDLTYASLKADEYILDLILKD